MSDDYEEKDKLSYEFVRNFPSTGESSTTKGSTEITSKQDDADHYDLGPHEEQAAVEAAKGFGRGFKFGGSSILTNIPFVNRWVTDEVRDQLADQAGLAGTWTETITNGAAGVGVMAGTAVIGGPVGRVVSVLDKADDLYTAGDAAEDAYRGDYEAAGKKLLPLVGAAGAAGKKMGVQGSTPGKHLSENAAGPHAKKDIGSAAPPTAPKLTGITEKHHLLPQQFEKRFKDAGLDIEDFVIPLDRAKHRLKPDGIHAGPWEDSWNGVWKKWLDKYPNATPEQIRDQLTKMRKQFGI